MQRLIAVTSALVLLAAPLCAQGFADVTLSSGTGTPPNLMGLLGRGACCGDFDGDGDQDLVVPGGGGVPGGQAPLPIYYFRNDGGGAFTDLTAGAGLGISGDPKAVVPGDVDNDGDLDLFIANLFFADQLFINDGSGVFTEEGALRGVASTQGSWSVSFGDFDRDGWLDVYIGGRHSLTSLTGEANRLLRNVGGGYFQDVTATAGVGNLGFTLSAPFVDFDLDGWPDIYVANDKGTNGAGPPSTMFRNNGNGTFTDIGASIGAQLAIDGMGIDFADVFNRGFADFYVTDIPPDHHMMIWDPGSGSYQDQTAQRGVQGALVGWGAYFMDYDNDAWQDLFVVHSTGVNHMYHHPGGGVAGGPWSEMAAPLGLDAFTLSGQVSVFQYSCVMADFDDDGGIDLYHVLPAIGNRLTLNAVPRGNWLKVRTVGTRSNRDGIGARVSVTVGASAQTRFVVSGTGYLDGSDLRCHFGLGPATVVDRVDIAWPSGQRQVFTGVGVNQVLVAQEPAYTLQGAPTLGTSPLLDLSIPGDAGLPFQAVVSTGTTPGITLGDGRVIPANPDWLLLLGLDLGWPLGSAGNLSASGAAQMVLALPNAPSLSGWTLHTTAISVDPALPELVRTIMLPLPVTLQ